MTISSILVSIGIAVIQRVIPKLDRVWMKVISVHIIQEDDVFRCDNRCDTRSGLSLFIILILHTTKVNYDAIASRAVIQPIVESEDFGESLNGHGETGNGPDADVEHFPTTEKKGSLSYADAARGTKRYVSFE